MVPLKIARREFEIEYIAEAVARFGGNMSQAARTLGMNRPALHRKINNLRDGAAPATGGRLGTFPKRRTPPGG